MALTKNSTILISDISSALSGKQDKLAYVPVKSVNGTSADANGAVTISTGGGTATAVSNVVVLYRKTASSTLLYGGGSMNTNTDLYTLPSGGTWRGLVWASGDSSASFIAFQLAGGNTVDTLKWNFVLAIRTA